MPTQQTGYWAYTGNSSFTAIYQLSSNWMLQSLKMPNTQFANRCTGLKSTKSPNSLTELYKPISIGLIDGKEKWSYIKDYQGSAHSTLNKIVQAASEGFIYKVDTDSDFYNRASQVLSKDKGKFRLDLTQDIVTGKEFIWNQGDRSGSIVLKCKKSDLVWEDILPECFDPSVLENHNTGQTRSAVKYCKKAASEDYVGICFSEYNGLEWILVFADEQYLNNLYELAFALTKKSDWYKKNFLE